MRMVEFWGGRVLAECRLIQEDTPLGFRVYTTRSYWDIIVSLKHPVMSGREDDVPEVLRSPDEVRRSIRDPSVFLFYRLERPGRWLCVVVKRLDGEGFIITAYPTDAIKTGEPEWNS